MFVQKAFYSISLCFESPNTNTSLLLVDEAAPKKPLCCVAIRSVGRRQHCPTGPLCCSPDGIVATSCPRVVIETMPTSIPLEEAPRRHQGDIKASWFFGAFCSGHQWEASPTAPYPSPGPNRRTRRPPARSHLTCFSPRPHAPELPPAPGREKDPKPQARRGAHRGSQQAPCRRQSHPSRPGVPSSPAHQAPVQEGHVLRARTASGKAFGSPVPGPSVPAACSRQHVEMAAVSCQN